MKKRLLGSLIAALFLIIPVCLQAGDLIAEADGYYEQGNLDSFKKAIGLYEQATRQDPANFEAWWKLARAHQWYGDLSQSRDVSGWKEICVEHGKAGMNAADKAIALKPNNVEGHFFKGCCAGTLSEGAGIMTLIKEDIVGTIESSFLKAYEIDKRFDHGGPMQAIGQFYMSLPWPFNDKKKAMQYLRENQQIYPDDPCGQVILAQLLIKQNKRGDRDEARQLLQKATKPDPQKFLPHVVEVYSKKARNTLNEM